MSVCRSAGMGSAVDCRYSSCASYSHFWFFVVAVNRNISMATADLISIMVGLGAPVLCVGSRVQRLGYVAAVWRRDAVDAGHH